MTKSFIIVMWLLLGRNDKPSSYDLTTELHETQSDCQRTAQYLNSHGFPGQRCVAVKVQVPA